jgi:hypothetical protein
MFVAVLTENIEVAEEASKQKHLKNRNSIQVVRGEPNRFIRWLRKWNPFALNIDGPPPQQKVPSPYQPKVEKRTPDAEEDDFIMRSDTVKRPAVSAVFFQK